MFNQLVKAFKSDDKKRQEEQIIRLDSIVEEVRQVLKNRGVNYYECIDIFHELQGKLNFQVASTLQQNHKDKEKLKLEINDLILKLKSYELADKPEEDSGKEAKQ